jgi:SAM-dependent methyltransferase
MKVKLPRTYAEQTYASPYRIFRYPHRRRFEEAVAAIRERDPQSLLDYGAGDGYLFERMLEQGKESLPRRVLAYEPSSEYARMLQERLRAVGADSQVEVRQSVGGLGDESFESIVCLSVLEHLPLPERQKFYRLCERHLAENGRCLIEVPVEVGLSLLIKELGRTFLKGRQPGYSLPALIRAVAGRLTFDPNRFDPANQATWIHEHVGFDYRLFAKELEHRFQIVRTFPTPFLWLPAWLANQEVFFIVERRDRRD